MNVISVTIAQSLDFIPEYFIRLRAISVRARLLLVSALRLLTIGQKVVATPDEYNDNADDLHEAGSPDLHTSRLSVPSDTSTLRRMFERNRKRFAP
jgi:hypothetical protein